MTRIAYYIDKLHLGSIGLLLYATLFYFSLKPAQAQEYKVGDVPNVHLVDSTLWLSDPAHLLAVREAEEINRKLGELNRHYGVEMVCVLLPSVGDAVVEEFANNLFRSWGLGSKKGNNGLLYLIVLDQRKQRLEVGYGLEGVLTDSRSIQLLDRYARPYFRKGEYGVGILSLLEALDKDFDENMQELIDLKDSENSDEGDSLFILLGFWLIGFTLLSLVALFRFRAKFGKIENGQDARGKLELIDSAYSNCKSILFFGIITQLLSPWLSHLYKKLKQNLEDKSKVCDRCHEPEMKLLSQTEAAPLLDKRQQTELQLRAAQFRVYRCAHCGQIEIHRKAILNNKVQSCPNCGTQAITLDRTELFRDRYGNRYKRAYYSCKECGYSFYKDQNDDDDSSLLPLLLGAMSSVGRGHSGGFGGGSFGGGSSGGGGATGGW